ncbi:capsular biosynthesis protein [Pseudoalteromonas sp. SSM20]|uniref:capsular polysaccharide export protein, LipB/KpsS family n=1 Tax=Pseudoalteromonas sp. SSM20 TaxID=3139394 RepID=UPI003BAD18B6
MRILFVSRNSSHAKYYRKLVAKLNLDAQLHVTGWPRLGALKHLNRLPDFDSKEMLEHHLLRKKARHPKLFSSNLFCRLFCGYLKAIETLRFLKFIDLFQAEQPDKVVVWNGKKLPNQTVVCAAESLNIPVMFFENGLVPNTTCLDPKGVNYLSSLPKSPSFYLERELTGVALASIEQAKNHKKRLADNPIESLPEEYIFVPFQVPNDTQVVVHSPWIKTMEQLFDEVMKAVDALPYSNLKVVFKEHPNWPKKFTHLHNAHAQAVFANNVKATELIKNAKATITINSTVGLETLQLGGKLITLGNACYALPGMVLAANSADQLVEQLSAVMEWQPNTHLIERFLDYVNGVYAIPQAWRRADKNHIQAIESRLLGCDEFSTQINH